MSRTWNLTFLFPTTKEKKFKNWVVGFYSFLYSRFFPWFLQCVQIHVTILLEFCRMCPMYLSVQSKHLAELVESPDLLLPVLSQQMREANWNPKYNNSRYSLYFLLLTCYLQLWLVGFHSIWSRILRFWLWKCRMPSRSSWSECYGVHVRFGMMGFLDHSGRSFRGFDWWSCATSDVY